ncbi:chemotaxis protein CheD [Rhodobacteraceae bacterium D3-12]|nr:chemotaxis protein CheD [Rhodobacteraceae bacterium D3-12]
MNHFLLPGEVGDQSGNTRYGVNAMELLVNGLIKQGAARHRLLVKLFGGAKMFEGSVNVGDKNAGFARWFMKSEGIPVVTECLRGRKGRKIRFWPSTGRAQRMFMTDDSAAAIERDLPVAPTNVPAPEGAIELF